MEFETATIDAPAKARKRVTAGEQNDQNPTQVAAQMGASQPAAPKQAIAGAHVGLPVQFMNLEGELLPARLQRASRINPSLWDVKISLNGSSIEPTRYNVPHSDTPKKGYWNFIPK